MKNTCSEKLQELLRKNDHNSAKETFNELLENEEWASTVSIFMQHGRPCSRILEVFRDFWTVSGHNIREQIGNDCDLTKILWLLMPKYQGNCKLLYRGENIDRWKEAQIGYCWTENQGIAEMFGRGKNAVRKGGVLLRANCPANAIISGAGSHSNYLGEQEFIVDPKKIPSIDCLVRYPPV